MHLKLIRLLVDHKYRIDIMKNIAVKNQSLFLLKLNINKTLSALRLTIRLFNTLFNQET